MSKALFSDIHPWYYWKNVADKAIHQPKINSSKCGSFSIVDNQSTTPKFLFESLF